MAWVTKTALASIADVSAAALVSQPTQTRAAVDARVSATAEGIIGDIITDNPAVTQAVIDTIEGDPTLLGQLAWQKGALASGTNLDTVTADGVVRADTVAVATTIVNRPPGFDRPFEVAVRRISTVHDTVVQEARLAELGESRIVYMERVGVGDVWHEWVEGTADAALAAYLAAVA